MKAYLLVTGSLFGLAGVMHLVRLFVERGHSLAVDPLFLLANIGFFLIGGGFALWAYWLSRALAPGVGKGRFGAGPLTRMR